MKLVALHSATSLAPGTTPVIAPVNICIFKRRTWTYISRAYEHGRYQAPPMLAALSSYLRSVVALAILE